MLSKLMVGFGLLALAGAQAASVVFTVSGTLTDGSAITGTMTIDTTAGSITAAAINVGAPDNKAFTIAGAYQFAAGSPGYVVGMTTSGTLLQLTLTSNATGTLVGYAGGPINTTAANFSFYGSSADPVTSGSLSSAAPPTVSKAFGASTVAVGGSTSVTITITNPNANALSALNFTDTLPAGLQVSSPTGLSNTCNGVAIASIGGSTIQLSGGTLAGNTSCAVGANVTGVTAGSNVNSVTVSSSAGNSNTGTATLVVLAPPGLTKSFSPPLLTYFNVTTLTFTISNPNPTVALTGVGFTDNLPGGLLVAGPAGVTTTCPSGSIGASPGGSSIVLSALTLAGGSSCTVSVNVSGFADGNITNTATPTSSNGGTGSPATATISVRRYMLYLWFFS